MFEILNRMYKLAVYDRNGRQYLPVRHPYKDEIAVYMHGNKAIQVEIDRFVEEDRLMAWSKEHGQHNNRLHRGES